MNIKKIKETYTCLDYLGDKVVKKVANGWLARTPWRTDNHPSLTITPNGKGWHDLATGEHGSVIDMVMRCLNTRDVRVACEHLECANPHFSLPQSNSEYYGGKEKGVFTRFDVMPLQSRGLFAYLHSRCINIEIAKQFLQEAHYSTKEPDDGTYLYALAYGNDLGGYELRNGLNILPKLAKAPKGITTHFSKGFAPTVVFEGFMDMLSFATLCGEVKHNYVVLNSTVMKESAVMALKPLRNQIYLCLDNDKGGELATEFMMQQLPGAVDIRSRFQPYKDVNDYLISR